MKSDNVMKGLVSNEIWHNATSSTLNTVRELRELQNIKKFIYNTALLQDVCIDNTPLLV